MQSNTMAVWDSQVENRLLDLREIHALGWEEISDILSQEFPYDYYEEQCRSKYRRLKAAGWNVGPSTTTTTGTFSQESDPEEHKLGVSIDWMKGELTGDRVGRAVTEDELMMAANLSRDEWRVTRAKANCWPTTFKDKESKAVQVFNHQLTLYLEPIMEVKGTRAILDEMLGQIREESDYPVYKYLKADDGVQEYLYEIDLMDVHLACLAWGKETGEDQDLNIISKRLMEVVVELVAQVRHLRIARFLLPIGNDFFHIDSLISGKGGATTAGTPQDVDSRWQKAFMLGRKLMTEIILLLLEVAPVDILIVPGNHDEQRSWYLGEVLDAQFHNNPAVRIDNRPDPRKYYRYGRNLIGFTHGSEEQLKDLPQLMSQEARVDWGETYFREWHLGHHHKEFTDEKMGVKTRRISSITSRDAWHNKKGYVQNIRGARGFVWSLERGINSIQHYDIPPSQEEMARKAPLLRGDST